MRTQVYRTELDGPDIVRLHGLGEMVKVELEGRLVEEIRLTEIHRGVAVSLGNGRELSLMGGNGAERIVVKLDGERLLPIVKTFNWPAYVPHVLLGTSVFTLVVATLAFAEVEWVWRLAIRREVLLLSLAFAILYRFKSQPLISLAGVAVMLIDLVYVFANGIWNPFTLLLRLLVAAYLARAAFVESQQASSEL